MGRKKFRDPSPLQTGIIHAGLSVAVFGGIATVIGTGIHFTGDANAAGPRQVIALFDVTPKAAPSLSGRLPDDIAVTRVQQSEEPMLEVAEIVEPTFDLQPTEAAWSEPLVSIPSPVEPPREGIRINGKFVPTGSSLSQVTAQEATVQKVAVVQPAPAKTAPPVKKTISADGLYERMGTVSLPTISKDGHSVFEAFSRPFANPEGKPTVSLIVGGLGLKSNGRYTNAAIEELPPEVTLSFVANAANLNTLVKRARAAGHEVILEAPMEAYETGRRRSHPKQLATTNSPEVNARNLAWALSQTSGYIALMNYEGGKFSTDQSAVGQMMTELSRRGVGFVESGSLPGSKFKSQAKRASARFALSEDMIDIQADSASIEERLKELERLAIENGKSLGTGFPYPVTIDTVKAWAGRLESKGIVLAPASNAFSNPKTQPAIAAQARAVVSDGAR